MLFFCILLAATSSTPFDSLFTHTGKYARESPDIDGVIEEKEWQGAALAQNFILYEPQRGSVSDQKTEVLVLYDEGHLYVAFRVYDKEPNHCTAIQARRRAFWR